MTIISLATLNGSNGFRIAGASAADQSGFSVSDAGDVNGDGFADVVIGTYRGTPYGIDRAGSSYVVFGKASGFTANVNLSGLDGSDGFLLVGVDAVDYSGRSVSAAGDVNGDGFADIIVGAFDADPNGVTRAGESYLAFGKSSGFTSSVRLAELDGSDGFRLDGIDASDSSGYSVSEAGDVNGDGFSDLIVGAAGADPNGTRSGESYLVFGKASGFAAGFALNDLDGADGFRLEGTLLDLSGEPVSGAGDLNGDGFGDIIIGASGADPNGNSQARVSYVVFGKATNFSSAIDLGALDGADGFRIDGIDAGDVSGDSLSDAGDVNGDGFDDLIIGARRAAANGQDEAGESYVIFGKTSGFTANIALGDLDGADGFRLDGISEDDYSGLSVSGAGDVNGDGFDDLIVGASRGDPPARSHAGESYVVFGKASGFAANISLGSLDGTDGFRLNGIDRNDYSGRSVSGAGDVNGDGFDDLIVGAFLGDPSSNSDAGESYVVFGFDSGAVTHQGTSASETLTGNAAANVIIGGLGADTLIGAGGLDALRGGGGDDILDVADVGFQRVNGGTGLDTLRLSGTGVSLDFTAVGSQLVDSIELIDLAGIGSKVTLDRLSLLNLSEASNSLTVSGSAGAKLSLADEGWSLTSDNGSTHTFNNGAATITLESTLGRDVTGTDIAETMLGSSGDDTLAGLGGDDLLLGGDGSDTADYSRAAGLVSINLTNGAVQDGDGGSDTLASIENVTGSAFNDTLIGDASANILSGGNGIDRLNGRDGDDIMRGGGGNDIYTVTDLGDVVTELSGEGNDRINVFIDYTNPDNVEFLVGKFAAVGLNLTGNENRDQITGANKINSPDTIFGLDGNDRLVGLVGNDVIDGGAGNDRIFGNSGFDVINGGAGNDVVTGQQGADTFVFGVAEGRDTVTDFDGTQDQIDLSAHSFANFAAVQAATTDIDGSAVIDLGGLNHVRLLGVLEAVLAADDFILA